ncbi:MAG: hypothetical protein SOI44_10045 [Lactimicrobium sp.]|jgi:hypothetical protein|uniref:hypothetical protein n=1 Tax=Lactimicrobium sp. TaxID=2563780 RepID=UPI002F35EDE4
MASHARKKIILSIIWAAIALLSVFVFAKFFSSYKILKGTYDYLDTKKNQVMGINAAVTGAAMIAGALPKQMGSAIVATLTNLQKPCLTVLAAVFAERYLASIFIDISLVFLIPIACIFGIIYQWLNDGTIMKNLAFKLATMGIVLSLTIPASVFLSKHIENVSSANEKIEEVQRLDQLEEEINNETQENNDTDDQADEETANDENIWDKIVDTISDTADEAKDQLEKAANTAKVTIQKIKNWINGVIEALVIMIVTSCFIPIIVFVILFWLLKLLFQIDVPAAAKKITTVRKKKKIQPMPVSKEDDNI